MKKVIVIHPFLFAIYPILALFAHNISFVGIRQFVPSLVVVVVSATFLFLLLSFILKNKKKAGLIVSLIALVFFSYGHIYNSTAEFIRGIFKIRPYKILISLSFLTCIFGTAIFIRTRRNLNNLTKILNVVSAFLILITLINIAVFKIKSGFISHKRLELKSVEMGRIKTDALPNIYYIILDAYARSDVLRELYEYDNSDFINYLTGKGFYVANQSSTNYCQSVLSLASSLNLDYLDDLVAKVGSDNGNRKWLTEMMNHSYVFRFLKQYGYKTIAFDAAGPWEYVKVKTADVFYQKSGLNLFEEELLSSTFIPTIIKKWEIGENQEKQYTSYREKLLFAFDKIEDLSKTEELIFIYAHFLTPHQPFVFGESGESVDPGTGSFNIWEWNKEFRKGYKERYKRQLSYVNKRVIKLIDTIISNSIRPPIIILQADHGPTLMLDTESVKNTNIKERMSILNAYYLPGGADKELYQTITPVNTFRILFNHYFGTSYPLLDDKIYFSTWGKPLDFIEVTDDKVVNP